MKWRKKDSNLQIDSFFLSQFLFLTTSLSLSLGILSFSFFRGSLNKNNNSEGREKFKKWWGRREGERQKRERKKERVETSLNPHWNVTLRTSKSWPLSFSVSCSFSPSRFFSLFLPHFSWRNRIRKKNKMRVSESLTKIPMEKNWVGREREKEKEKKEKKKMETWKMSSKEKEEKRLWKEKKSVFERKEIERRKESTLDYEQKKCWEKVRKKGRERERVQSNKWFFFPLTWFLAEWERERKWRKRGRERE